MRIEFTTDFQFDLLEIVSFIARDKPIASRKFKNDLIKKIQKDLKQPFNFQKSKYYQDENIRDYVFKGYTSVDEIDLENNTITVFGFIKYKESL